MAVDAGAVAGNGHPAGVQAKLTPLVAEANVIRVTKQDNWEGLGVRVAAAACGEGVALMRAVGKDSVYSAVRGFIHARSIAALRGLDLQATMGYQDIRIGIAPDEALVSAVVIYAFARHPDRMTWEAAPSE